MILFPAIDLKDGACVRLVRGDMATAKVFNEDPAAQAQRFADAGFSQRPAKPRFRMTRSAIARRRANVTMPRSLINSPLGAA